MQERVILDFCISYPHATGDKRCTSIHFNGTLFWKIPSAISKESHYTYFLKPQDGPFHIYALYRRAIERMK